MDDEMISSPKNEFNSENDGNKMDVDDDEDSDATHELDNTDFGAATEFHVDDERNDDDDEDTTLEESDDDDNSDLAHKRLFP